MIPKLYAFTVKCILAKPLSQHFTISCKAAKESNDSSNIDLQTFVKAIGLGSIVQCFLI